MSSCRYWLRILLTFGVTVTALSLLVWCLALHCEASNSIKLHYTIKIGTPVPISNNPDPTFTPPRLTEESRQEIEGANYETSAAPWIVKRVNGKHGTTRK